MSSEPVKSVEIDCPISPYSQHHIHHPHHHHHHHVLTCHHQNNQHSHVRLDVTGRNEACEMIEDDNDLQEENGSDEDQIEKIRCLAHNKLNDCNDRLRCKITIEQEGPNINGGFLTSSCSGVLTGNQVTISDPSDLYELANTTIASSTSTSPTSLQSSSPPSSTSSDSSSSIEDGDDEDDDDDNEADQSDYGEQIGGDEDIDDEGDEDSVSSDDVDGDDENDEQSYDEECEDIVDPVGHHRNQSNIDCNEVSTSRMNDCNEIVRATNPLVDQIDESISDDEDDDEDDDDDVSFDENEDSDEVSDQVTLKHSNIDSSPTPDLLDSERMLEVTRKLVRSTERDPDRDLRKQVLLKTAIRKLPHFMEYNHYTDSFDQSLQLHSSNLACNGNDGNVSVNCLPTAHYYEHHHLHMNHHIDSQPKSYYHSVQPNAIQMSTTSLRMLDLNDDQESETSTIISNEQHQQSLNHNVSYGVVGNLESNMQTGPEQQQSPHDYATHSQQPTLNMYHYSHQASDSHQNQQQQQPISAHDAESLGRGGGAEAVEDNQQTAIQQLSSSTFTHDSGTNMIAHHDTIEHLYQPLASGDIDSSADSRVAEDSPSIAFQIACNYTVVTDSDQRLIGTEAHTVEDKSCLNEIKTFDNLDDLNVSRSPNDSLSVTSNTLSDNPIANEDILKQQNRDNHYHVGQQGEQTTVNSCFCKIESTESMSQEIESNSNNTLSSLDNRIVDENILSEVALTHDPSSLITSSGGGSDGNSNSSTHSSTSLDEGFSATTRPNDMNDDIITSSLLETSLNSTKDYHHSSHDSGVALLSPRSNKRSSSSIGLDDEMDIDNLGDLVSMSQHGPCHSGSNLNHCKKLRKREILD